MSDRTMDMEGTPVSEEEVAQELGFDDVFAFRRWGTDAGREIEELKAKLREAEGDASNFRWHGRRMQAVLERVEQMLKQLPFTETSPIADYLKAIAVVCGREADWGGVLRKAGWFGSEQQTRNRTHRELLTEAFNACGIGFVVKKGDEHSFIFLCGEQEKAELEVADHLGDLCQSRKFMEFTADGQLASW